MTASVLGLINWGGGRDESGHRTYKVKWSVETTNILDGPDVVLSASGLSAIGSTYAIGNDYDAWAFCTPEAEVIPKDHEEGEPTRLWTVEQTFTSKPRSEGQEGSKESPLNTPHSVRGSFQQMMREIGFDKNGDWIKTASYEPVRGPQVERNIALPTVSISINYATLPLADITLAMNKVNSLAMWGLAPRYVRLVSAPWERKYLHETFTYYTITFEFLCDLDGFDKPIIQEGNRALRTAGLPLADPESYEPAVDGQGNPTTWLLNANGTKKITGTPEVFTPVIDKEYNFFLFGLPAVL